MVVKLGTKVERSIQETCDKIIFIFTEPKIDKQEVLLLIEELQKV